MKGIIGYSGFVGGNLDKQIKFDKKYNSKNISEICGEKFDILYCAGISAVKWYANQNPEKDLENVNRLIDKLKNVEAKKIVVISTIDIYDTLGEVNEETLPDKHKQDSYGKNRYHFEKWVKNNFDDYLIIRLPALFGEGLKKNFIYDLLNPLPSIILNNKWEELERNLSNEKFNILRKIYINKDNENYILNKKSIKDLKKKGMEILKEYGFLSINFTDSRSFFPFYNLENLSKDINIAINNNLKIVNFSVEPVGCKEIVEIIFNKKFENYIKNRSPVYYDMKSKYDYLYGGEEGYLYTKEQTIKFLKDFISKELNK